MKLSQNQLQVLKALLSTFSSENKVDMDAAANLVVEIINSLPNEQQKEFEQLLWVTSSPVNGFLGGNFKSVTRQTEIEKQKMLLSWSNSFLGDLRKAFMSVKKLACFVEYGFTKDGETNANWEVIGYPGPIGGQTPDPNPLNILNIESETTLTCDVVIVGSGAGGSVMAAELAKKGLEVIVIEKGKYFKSHEFTQRESDTMANMFERKGALTSHDGAVAVLAGSCVGGGTTINWSGSLRTPDYILDEWASKHDNPQFLDTAYDECFEAIEKRCSINTDFGKQNMQNQKLWEAAENLEYDVNHIPINALPAKNETEWKAYNYGCMGDVYRNKQTAQNTFLLDACNNGAKILPNTYVEKVTKQNGFATGIEGISQNSYKIKIKSKYVVAACGAVQTPALLLRSGLQHDHIGKNLYLHPVVPVQGIYNHKIEAWYGPMMTTSVDEFTQLDGNFGFKIECPPAHPGLMALAMPWQNAKQFENDMKRAANLATFFPLVRDKFGGQVWLTKDKKAEVRYDLHQYDKKHLLKGLVECIKLHYEAGATEIKVAHNNSPVYLGEEPLEVYLKKIQNLNWDKNKFILFSAHQMGTCRMGGTRKKHPLKPNGETREVKNLFVADASAFPKCSGANPMLSIQALSYYIAKHIH